MHIDRGLGVSQMMETAACRRFYTQKYIERTGGKRGEVLLKLHTVSAGLATTTKSGRAGKLIQLYLR